MNNEFKIVRYNDLPQGGFAGIVEKQLAKSTDVWPQPNPHNISNGLSDFIYLSLGHFQPNDGAPIHPHKDVDIVSFIYSGEIGHKGSLGDGTKIQSPGVQVQRAGTGMTHSEFSISKNIAKFAQIWFLPPEKGLEPDYKDFSISTKGLTTVHGGPENTFNSSMTCQIGFLDSNTPLKIEGPFVAIPFEGSIEVNGTEINESDLIEGSGLSIATKSRTGLILIHENKK